MIQHPPGLLVVQVAPVMALVLSPVPFLPTIVPT